MIKILQKNCQGELGVRGLSALDGYSFNGKWKYFNE